VGFLNCLGGKKKERKDPKGYEMGTALQSYGTVGVTIS
jgi:hypothetical protein